MKDAWIPIIGAAAVAIISLGAAVYLRSSKQAGEIGARWNQAAAIIVGAAVAILATRLGNLDWYFAIPLGALAFGAIRLPAYVRHGKNASSDQNRKEISN
ncbi:hypothetical protein [Bradyrhizobium cosmicum]|uniref:hypothetical protein n=1 Tax=Bradyrhizobium cosmicum TaxID=1404864 RepID=UPI001161CF46|nr:hypothetical protein [Bradyrhizobium cosmicum]QDP21579.1 hypothetical protein FNV92_05130 [Bradyrhizobium cosmicum]